MCFSLPYPLVVLYGWLPCTTRNYMWPYLVTYFFLFLLSLRFWQKQSFFFIFAMRLKFTHIFKGMSKLCFSTLMNQYGKMWQNISPVEIRTIAHLQKLQNLYSTIYFILHIAMFYLRYHKIILSGWIRLVKLSFHRITCCLVQLTMSHDGSVWLAPKYSIKLAKPSLSHRSSHQSIVTIFPNHWKSRLKLYGIALINRCNLFNIINILCNYFSGWMSCMGFAEL